MLADCFLLYTQLAVQLANLTATDRASLVHTPTKKKAPTGNKRGRPKATEVVAKTNRKIDEYYRKNQSRVISPCHSPTWRKRRKGSA